MWQLVYKRAGVPDSSIKTAQFSDGLLAVKRTRFLVDEGFQVMGLYCNQNLVMNEQQLVARFGEPQDIPRLH
ncbi:MAG TPA: hypothetical protein VM074_06660 [Solimonas sp.]|nr:hypothetical protein [Solimonas sp.]